MSVRKLHSHKQTPLNDVLAVSVLDEPGPGGACHNYMIFADESVAKCEATVCCIIQFQKGPILEAGVNGISIETLLAVVEDRLQGFQSGEFACRENAIALTKIQEAMMWLGYRTADRIRRGVEGKNQR